MLIKTFLRAFGEAIPLAWSGYEKDAVGLQVGYDDGEELRRVLVVYEVTDEIIIGNLGRGESHHCLSSSYFSECFFDHRLNSDGLACPSFDRIKDRLVRRAYCFRCTARIWDERIDGNSIRLKKYSHACSAC